MESGGGEVFGVETAAPISGAEVEGFLEGEGDEDGTFALAIPEVVRVVGDLGVVGEFELVRPRAEAFESEEVRSEVFGGGGNVGRDLFEVFPEDGLSLLSGGESEEKEGGEAEEFFHGSINVGGFWCWEKV